MSMNIDQVFIANPITSNAGTDLMYFGQSPYGAGNDAAMTFTNFASQFALSSAIINPAHGGTGVNNGTSTITIGGNFAMSGAFTFTGTITGNTAVTFPTSGTLATVGQIVTWNDVASGTQALAVNQGYVTNNGASLVTYTLPATAAEGSIIEISGKSAGGWTINYATGQIIHIGNLATTVTTGTLSSSNQWDYVKLLCVTANTTFNVIGGVGNFTIV
jgi:hypothetical protein